jgi:hypothetical protein
MAGGYGGQEIALDVNDSPLNLVSPLEQWQQYQGQQTENQYRSALTDSLAQSTAEKAQLFPSQLQATQQRSTQNTQAFQKQQVAESLGLIDPNGSGAPDKFKSSMQKLADGGNTYAQQLVDAPWTPQKHQQWVQALTAQSPLQAASAMSQTPSSAAPLPPLDDETIKSYDVRFNGQSKDQLAATQKSVEAIRQGVIQMRSTSDLQQRAQIWDQTAQAAGRPELVGKYDPNDPGRIDQIWQGLAPLDAYLTQRISQAGAGAPGPVVGGQLVKRDDGSEYELIPTANGLQAKQVIGPTQKWSSPNAAGVSIDAHSGATRNADGGTVGPQGPVFDQIGQFATQDLGASAEDAAILRRQAFAESGGQVNGPNSSTGRQGLFQFDKATFNRYNPGGNISSLQDQTRAAYNMLQENRKVVAGVGAANTEENAYIVAQQGAGGGAALLSAEKDTPDAKAVDVLTPHYLVGPDGQKRTEAQARAVASSAITKNGGSLDMTAGQFADHIRSYYDNQAQGGGSVAGGAQMPGGYSADTFTRYALQEVSTGKAPQWQRGEIAAKKAYENFYSQKLGEWGISQADLNDRAATFKALGATQTKMTGIMAQVDSSERTASANADLAVSAMKNMGESQLPPINKIQQGIRGQLLGDPKVVDYTVKLGTFLDEYAKVMSSNTGSGGVTSDNARQTAYERLSQYTSQSGLEAGINAMKQDMANKTGSLHGELQEIRSTRAGLVPNAQGDATHAASAPEHGANYPANPTGASSVWKGYTNGQLWAAQRYRGSSDPEGSQGNPLAAASPAAVKARIAQANPTAQNPFYYIDPHGNVLHYP